MEHNEETVRALLELGKVTFEKISEQAAKIVTSKCSPQETWLSCVPHQILQAFQGVHGHAANMAAAREMDLITEQGIEKGKVVFKAEAENPALIFLLAGLAPPIDPVAVLLQTEIFVAAWKSHYEETKKREHLSALSLLFKIKKIKEQYRVPDQSKVANPEQVH